MSGVLALKFALELALLAAAAWWGAHTGGIALAVATPLVVALLWARFAAPRSVHRLDGGARVAFELALFALAAAGLATTGAPAEAASLLIAAVLVTVALERPRG